jgi:curli biogenesis system outer membrane secretion channel CsgG
MHRGKIAEILIITGMLSGVFAESAGTPSCAVVGFVNELRHEAWRDARVGMGVRAMLTQSLHQTGLFTLLEEKDDVRASLAAVREKAWMEKKGGKYLDVAADVLKKQGARFTAIGRVYYFGKPRTKASVGPVHLASDEVIIKIEVTLIDAIKGNNLTAAGSGNARTTATSALFTFHGEHLDADQSMVATATKKAIDEAVEHLAKQYRKKYRIQ